MLRKRVDLEKLKVEELRNVCRQNGISYHRNNKKLTKAAMIEEIIKYQLKGCNDVDTIVDMIVSEEESEIEEVVAKQLSSEEEALKKERKQNYIDNASVGTIIAFELPNKKVISAMITKKSTKGRKFKTVTKYGVEHVVPFENVLWVKTNKRWPKGVYLLFKKNIDKSETKGVSYD